MKTSRMIILLIVLAVSAVLVLRSCGTGMAGTAADVSTGGSGPDAADPSPAGNSTSEGTSSKDTSSKSTSSGDAPSEDTSRENAPVNGTASARYADNADPGKSNDPDNIGTESPDDMDGQDEDRSPVVDNYVVEIQEDEYFEIG